jgi:putative hydrolase of the HAD superfamily
MSLARTGADLTHIDAWLFDLDETLYPASNGLMDLIRRRITDYVVKISGLPFDEARVLQRGWFETHGAALPGMLAQYNTTPADFLAYVHDLPLDGVIANPELDAALSQLPGRRFVFTNGSAAHAERVLAKLGIAARFEGVFHIEAADLLPKPAPATYDRMIAAFGIAPAATCFFEDSSKNLEQAHILGMTTVLVGEHGAPAPHIDYITPDLLSFLTSARVKEPHR